LAPSTPSTVPSVSCPSASESRAREEARDGVDAQCLPNVEVKHQSDHLRLGLDDFVIRRGGVTLLHVPVPVRRAPEHTDRPLLRAVSPAVDSKGNLYVAEADPGNRVQKF